MSACYKVASFIKRETSQYFVTSWAVDIMRTAYQRLLGWWHDFLLFIHVCVIQRWAIHYTLLYKYLSYGRDTARARSTISGEGMGSFWGYYRLKGYFSRHCDMTQFTLTHHIVIKQFLLLGLAAEYRSWRWMRMRSTLRPTIRCLWHSPAN